VSIRNPRVRRACAFVAAVIACAVLAACSGGGSPSSTKKKSSTTGPGGNGLSSLVGKAAKAVYEVTYQAGVNTIVVAQDPPKYSTVQGNNSAYDLGDGTSVECTGKGLNAICVQLPNTGNLAQQSIAGSVGSIASTLFDALGKAGTKFAGTLTSEATIAGRDARCVTLDEADLGALVGPALKGTTKVCVDKQTGVLLESHADSATGADLLATSFGDPTATDFIPPSAPITAPPSTGSGP
jgi:hypothetical protein